MDFGIFVKSLDIKEKIHLTKILTEDQELHEGTDIIDWAEQLYKDCKITTRLRNIISNGFRKGNTLEDVTYLSFFKKKNAGAKTWEEFQQVRGY